MKKTKTIYKNLNFLFKNDLSKILPKIEDFKLNGHQLMNLIKKRQLK